MVFWKLHDDGQTPKEVYNPYVYFPALIVSVGGAVFGFTNSFFGSLLALPAFETQFHLDTLSEKALNDLSSNLAIAYQIGCFGACFLAYPLAEILGRRQAMFLASLCFLLGSCLMLAANLGAFYAGRFLTGLGVGPLTSIMPLYLAEISPPALRGMFIGFMDIMYQVGAIIGFWVGYGCAKHIANDSAAQWRIPVAIQIPMVVILLVGLPFVPETPRFLIKVGKSTQALRVVSKLRKLPEDHAYCQREMSLVEDELRSEREMMNLPANASIWRLFGKQIAECCRPGIRYRVSIGIITMMIGQFSGVNGLNYFSPRIFASLGLNANSALLATALFGIVNFITATVSNVWLIDRVGRRALLLGGGAIMVFSMFYIGTYSKIARPGESSTVAITSGGISALAFVYIYLIGFVGGYANITYVLAAELAPLNVRAMSATLGAAAQWLGNLAVVKATPYMITSLGYGTFYFFGSCAFLGSLYVYFYVPESRGVPMEELDVVFGMHLVHRNRSEEEGTQASPGELEKASDLKGLESVHESHGGLPVVSE